MKNKSLEKDEPKFTVKKREKREKPDYFQNVTPFAHPLAEILSFPASESSSAVDDSGLLADLNQSASFLASSSKKDEKTASLLADLNTENQQTASFLADPTKSVSRSALQLLADLKQSKPGRVQFGIRIRAEIKQMIAVFIAEQGITQQDFIEASAISFIEKFNEQLADLSDKPASKLAHDDRRLMKMWKSTPALINLYLRFNPKNRWTVKDDEVASVFNEVDLRLVELGFIQTQNNAGFRKRINSFSYYSNEIESWVEMALNDETVDGILQNYRTRWAAATGNPLPE